MDNSAESLILEYLKHHKDALILIMEGGTGWLATQAALRVPEGEVLTLDRDFRNTQAAKNLLKGISNARTSEGALPSSGDWDVVLLIIPKERRFTRSLLIDAWERLRPNGQLFLAGPTQKGAKAAIKDADRLFGNASVLGYRSHQRVALCTRGNALPDPLSKEFQQIGIAPGSTHLIEVMRPQRELNLETHPGIFSWKGLDEGTALLLDNLHIQLGTHVWDVGCGYGVIGLSAALAGAEFVAMSDVNMIATLYAHKNATRNGLDKIVKTFSGDVLSRSPESDKPFDLIVSNPAFHQGRDIDKSMADKLISSAPKFLAREGRLLLVANRFLNYDKALQEHFTDVCRIAETKKFHVIEACNGKV